MVLSGVGMSPDDRFSDYIVRFYHVIDTVDSRSASACGS